MTSVSHCILISLWDMQSFTNTLPCVYFPSHICFILSSLKQQTESCAELWAVWERMGELGQGKGKYGAN